MDSKPHYDILDGLRGTAALIVLCYHLFEAIAFAAGAPEQDFYHGFLAVDFFFVLSGFVMGYAYDEKWFDHPASSLPAGKRLSYWGFIKRRLIRLHPMVVMGVLIGVVCFCIQGCVKWDGTGVPLSQILTVTLLALFLLPTPTPLDIRGNTEAFPINGPHWSLFLEYLGSLLYAFVLRKFRTRTLKLWVGGMGIILLTWSFLSPDGGIAYGWSSEPINLFGGALRILFAYPAGLLLARLFREKKPSHLQGPVFLFCSLVMIGFLVVPHLHGYLDAFYQVLCVAVLFPALVWMGARGTLSASTQKCVSFLGRLSYPLYAVHYPFIYLYISWISADSYPLGLTPVTAPIAVAVVSLAVASIALLFYDEPLRKRLGTLSR